MVEEGRVGSSWSRVLVQLLLPSPSIISSGSVDIGGGGREGRDTGREGDGSGEDVLGK